MTIENLLEIMDRLRDPAGGCPWDLEQDFGTIAPYTIEEAYEVADAISRKDLKALRDELGDLLFQVVFHARMASEQGAFNFEDVVAGACDKMVRRHPHVFADSTIENSRAQSDAWERHKHGERQAREAEDRSALADIPVNVPALPRAAKLGKRAAAVGFDWPNIIGVRAKISEELAELDAELEAGGTREALIHELGDVLFAVTNLARHLDVNPEAALRDSNTRFEARFRDMEQWFEGQGRALNDCEPETLDKAWNESKRRLKSHH